MLTDEWSFDERAATYDKLSWVRDEDLLRAMRELIFRRRSTRLTTILDVATGTGAIAEYLSVFGELVIGLDLSMPMLKKASKIRSEPPIAYVRGAGEELPICDRSIDLVTCRNGLHQMAHPEAALGEIRRVLTKNGLLCVIESVAPSLNVKDQWAEMIMLKDRGRHPEFAFTAAELQKWLHRSKFEILDTSSHEVRFDVDEWIQMGGVTGERARRVRELFVTARRETKNEMMISENSCHLYASKVSHMILARPCE